MSKTTSLVIAALLVSVHASGTLIHRWSFDTDGNDSIGRADATLLGGATVSSGALQLSGSGAYAELPIDISLSGLNSVTIEAWATYNSLSPWGRIFDFGNGSPNSNPNAGYFFLTGSPEFSSTISFGLFSITQTANTAAQDLAAGSISGPGVPLHYAVTIDALTNVGTLYIDGAEFVSGTINLTPSDVISLDESEDNWLGRSRFTTDSFMNGSIDEFRIHNTALTSSEIETSFELGPSVIPEPSTYVLFALGAFIIWMWRRK